MFNANRRYEFITFKWKINQSTKIHEMKILQFFIQYLCMNLFDIPIRCFVGTQSFNHIHIHLNLKKQIPTQYDIELIVIRQLIQFGQRWKHWWTLVLMDLFLFWLCTKHNNFELLLFSFDFYCMFNHSVNCQSMMCQFNCIAIFSARERWC